jgi:hypothetical protein
MDAADELGIKLSSILLSRGKRLYNKLAFLQFLYEHRHRCVNPVFLQPRPVALGVHFAALETNEHLLQPY